VPFLDLGATATDVCDGTLSVVVETDLDVTQPGTYTVTYRATDTAGFTDTTTRTVIVEDTEGPEITLLGASPFSLECGTPYEEPGATALDACDGQAATVSIVANTVNPAVPGTYSVTYQATDQGGTDAIVTREVIVADTDAPEIHLEGDALVEIDCDTPWTDPGANATDACEGVVDVTSDAEAVVNTTEAGSYEITYLAQDSLGNLSVATRTVVIGGPVCEGGDAVCPLTDFSVIQPAGGTVMIPEGAGQQRVLFSAATIFDEAGECAIGTTRVTYTVDGAAQLSENRDAGYPVVFFLTEGEYTVEAVAEVVESDSTLSQSFQLSVVGADDGDQDGLVDQPFTSLAVEGDTWTNDTQAPGSDGTTTMTTWFGECDSASGDMIEVRVRNPENSAQVLTVAVERALLDCEEQGILTVAFGENLRNIFNASELGAISPAPAGVADDGPFFDVSLVVSGDGGNTFAPVAASRLAARPVQFSLTGVDVPDAETASFVRFPTTAVPDGNGGFDLEAGEGSWSSASIQNVTVDGTTIRGEAVSLSLFAPLAPEAGKDPNGASCAPGRGHGTFWAGDLMVALGLFALLVWSGRARVVR
jgi:hypothetical protein